MKFVMLAIRKYFERHWLLASAVVLVALLVPIELMFEAPVEMFHRVGVESVTTTIAQANDRDPLSGFDGVPGTVFHSISGTNSGTVVVHFPNKIKLDQVRILPQPLLKVWAPDRVGIEGSLDGLVWVKLGWFEAKDHYAALPEGTDIGFSVDSPQSYPFYRLSLEATGTDTLTFAEISFFSGNFFSYYLNLSVLVALIVAYLGLISWLLYRASKDNRAPLPRGTGWCDYRSSFLVDSFVLLAALVASVLVVVLVQNFYQVSESKLMAEGGSVLLPKYRFAVWPKPVERLQFVLLVLSVPVFLFFFFLLLDRWVRPLKGRPLTIGFVLVAGIMTVLFFTLVYFDFKPDPNNFLVRENLPYYRDIRGFIFWLPARTIRLSVLMTPLLAWVLLVSFRENGQRRLKVTVISALVVLIVALFALNLFTRDSYTGWYEHFNAAYYAVAQVFNGASLLVDFTNQYGLYPHFLEPIFRIIGLDVTHYAVVMALLVAFSYGLLLYFANKVIENKVLLFVGFVALVHLRFFFLGFFASYDLYFQYTPIRFLFPCLLLVLASLYFKKKSRTLYYVGFGVASVSVLWNIDSGFVVFFTWLASVIFDEAFHFEARSFFWKAARHVLVALLSLAIVVGLFGLYIFLRSGQFPHFGQFLKYQTIFYFTGFYMMNTPVFNAWNLVILAYACGLLVAVRSLLKGADTHLNRMVFVLSLLGVGLFSYYQGRSHDYVEFAVCYPAVLLMLLFIDNLLKQTRVLGFRVVLANPFFLFATFGLTLMGTHLLEVGFERKASAHGVLGFLSGALPNQALTDNITFLKANSAKGERVVILTEPGFLDGIYYGDSGTLNPVNVPGASELVLQEDLDRIRDFVAKNQSSKVFVTAGYGDPVVRGLLDSRYQRVAGNGDFSLFLPK